MFSLLKNLLKRQINGSTKIGLNINNKPIEIFILFVFNKIQIITPPRKLLPISPIKILDGCQFQNKNPINEPIIPQIDSVNINVEKRQNVRTEPDKIPSIPSIKLQKLIIPVHKNTNKITKKISILKSLVVRISLK